MSEIEKTLDVITIGRASVDLYGDQVGGRLEDMASFSKYVGGCPANISVGCARLGLDSALLTRVGDDYMGRYILEQVASEGVCTDLVVADPGRLTALAILGIRDKEQFPLLFYRENCADMAICEDDVKEEYVARSRAVLVTGTHLSEPGVRSASKKAIRLAKKHDARVVMDVDYRPVLWGLTTPELGEQRFVADETVTQELQTIIADCDLIVGTEEELHILGGSIDTMAAIRRVRELSNATIVCKRGALGCTVFDGAIGDGLDDGIMGRSFKIEVFNILGAGDAFMSGFLRGWLRDRPLRECCTWANACGALVVSRHGCAPAIPSWTELQYFLENGSDHLALRHDRQLEHIHWATNRKHDYPTLKILAVDHRVQFEALADEMSTSRQRISKLKSLTALALHQVARNEPVFGILLDGRWGEDALAMMGDYPYWIGRPIEVSGAVPLEFEGSSAVATEIGKWPLTQTVKCLVNYRMTDPGEMRERQDRQLWKLFDACRQTRHELMVEIITAQNDAREPDTIAQVMRHFYEIGVYPDWWKLEPIVDGDEFGAITKVIDDYDPLCRGVVLLGYAAPLKELEASFRAAASHDRVKGFAVGRSIWYEAARDWLAGDCDDDQYVASVSSGLKDLADAWDRAHEPERRLGHA
ncbi:MAG: 5-dehydro-2-deoxygluconokinase [Xanthomonadales bacterium]|nr:5-dehydro-2-deoxygluconokinase [Xanthomonadales bacterium]